jgi:SAM-dependent methyltransferase
LNFLWYLLKSMGRPLYRRVRHTLANHGLHGTIRNAALRIAGVVRNKLRKKENPESFAGEAVTRTNLIHPFDLTYGVDTGGLIWNEDLSISHPNGLWCTAYYGIAPSIFNQLIERPEFPQGPEWSEYTFLDLGSGKGRALMLASRFPFRAILGVEIVPELVRIARQNLAHFSAPWQKCQTFEVREGDAATFELPSTPLVIYLYHPFAKPVLDAFLANLEGSLRKHPRPVWLLYFNPQLDAVIARRNALERVFLDAFTMQVEDASADSFSNTREGVAVYRYVPRAGNVESQRVASGTVPGRSPLTAG